MNKVRSLFINILLAALLVPSVVLRAQSSRIDFDFKDKPLDEVIGFLIETYNMPIAYQDQQIRDIIINASCDNCSEDQAIQAVLQSTPISAYQLETQIILTKDESKQIDGKRSRIIGRIIDARDRASLPYANIIVKEHKKGTSSDLLGEFILEDLPKGPFVLKVLYIGYREEEQLITVPLSGQDTLTIALNEDCLESDAITVQGLKPIAIRTGELAGKTHLEVKRLNYIPSVGNTPVESAVNSLPGISGGFEVPAQFSFYGGRYDQNLFLLDGIPFYRPYHYYGLISAFHPRAIEQVDVYNGVIPVRFDNAVSGVIDATVNTVPENCFNWGLDADMFAAGGFMEWPVSERLKLFLAARSSWKDIGTSGGYYRDLVFFGRGYNSSDQNKLDEGIAAQRTYFQPTRFYDLLGKMQYDISDAARASLTFYYGKDLYGAASPPLTNPDSSKLEVLKNITHNENIGLSARYNYQWNSQFKSTVSYVYHHTLDKFEEPPRNESKRKREYSNKLSQQFLQFENSYTHGNFRYDLGLKGRRIGLNKQKKGSHLEHNIAYFQFFWQNPGHLDITAGLQRAGFVAWKGLSLHLAMGWQVLDNLKLTAGANSLFHANLDAVIGGTQHYDGQDNRYETFITYNNYNPVSNRSLGAHSYSGMGSYGFGLNSSLLGLQIDAAAWYTGYNRVKLHFDYDPDKVPGGEYWQLINPGVQEGDAFAAGFNISVRKQIGVYQGQCSYTRSSFSYRLVDFTVNNNYRLWPYNLHRKHQIKFINHVSLNNWDLSLSETWASPTRDVDVSYAEWLKPRLPLGMPYYNRTDLSVKRSGINIMDLNWTFNAGVLNVLNRQNVRLIQHQKDGTEAVTYGLPRTFYAGLQVSLH